MTSTKIGKGRVAVVGGGWAGLAAGVEAIRQGHDVTLFEMAPQLGGRARGVDVRNGKAPIADFDGAVLDNGQHILIGAYGATLALLELLEVDLRQAFLRTPLRIAYPDGNGLLLKSGSPALAFAGAVMRHGSWTFAERISLLTVATGWSLRRFKCDASTTVAALTAGLPRSIQADLIEPLCVAALNTPAREASGEVFLRVLRDALFSGAGSADLLLPCASLSEVFPDPASRWLLAAGATIHLRHRVDSLSPSGQGWLVDGQLFDRVVLAAPPGEAARLVGPLSSEWSRSAADLRYEPIVTVYLRSIGAELPEPMLALVADDDAPAQFVFDRGQLRGPRGLLAFVISGAQLWVDRGIEETERATMAQAQRVLAAYLRSPLEPIRTLVEKRATFRCTPSLRRPPMKIAPGLHAAGDYVNGPYPATLEGAVRSSLAAVRSFD